MSGIRFLRTALTAFLVACLLGACATAPSVGIEDRNAKRPSNSGYVAVQVVSNAETLGGPLRRWNALFVIEDRPGAEALFLPSLESADASTSVFVGALAPGRYRLIVLQAFEKIGDFTYRSRAAVPPFIGSFEVRTNQLTDLKTLLAQPLLPKTPNPEQTFEFVITRTDTGDDLERFLGSRLADELEGLTPERLGWNEDRFDELRAELHQVMVEHGLPRKAIRLSQRAKHDIFSFGRLGRYYLRDRETQTWAGASLPRPTEIFAASENGQGIAMAGERGSVFILDATSGAIRELPSPDVSGLAWDVDMIGDTLLLTVQSKTHWTWYSSADEGKQWRVEHREVREEPGYVFSVNAPSKLRSETGELTVWIEKQQLTRSLEGVWTAIDSKTEWVELVSQPNGTVVGLPYDWWTGVGNTQLSQDGGATWISTKSGKWGVLGPRSGTPYIFDDLSMLLTGESAKFNLIKGWTELPQVPLTRIYPDRQPVDAYGQVPYGCDRLRGEISTDDEIFALCKFGQLYVSKDQGRNFKLQFDPSLSEVESAAIISKHLQKLSLGDSAGAIEVQ